MSAGGGTHRPSPPMSETARPFWDATSDRTLVVQQCRSCDRPVWFPRVLCPVCGGGDLEWRERSGDGAVYAVSVQYRAPGAALADRVPYAVALVDLDCGVRMMSNVIDADPEEVTVGMRVRAAWEPLEDGRHLLVFAPEGSSSPERGRIEP